MTKKATAQDPYRNEAPELVVAIAADPSTSIKMTADKPVRGR